MLRYLKGKVATECGHKTERSGEIQIETSKGLKVINIYTKKSEIPCCIKCFEEGVIRCAKCGEPIFPGNPVTLHDFKSSDSIPDYAVKHNNSYISCMRHNCMSIVCYLAGYLDKKTVSTFYKTVDFESRDISLKIF